MFISVPTDIAVGSEVVGLLPATKNQFGHYDVNLIWGNVDFINDNNGDRILHVKGYLHDGTMKMFKIGEYRVLKYTFGGVLVNNSKWDKARIEKEDGVKIHNIDHII